jgi:hypothetical protein
LPSRRPATTSSPTSPHWDLEGLFIRLGAAIDAVGARRVVIDTIETLFWAFTDAATLRSEIQRLFVWLKARGVTVVITGERGDGQLTRHGIEDEHGISVQPITSLGLQHTVSSEIDIDFVRDVARRPRPLVGDAASPVSDSAPSGTRPDDSARGATPSTTGP